MVLEITLIYHNILASLSVTIFITHVRILRNGSYVNDTHLYFFNLRVNDALVVFQNIVAMNTQLLLFFICRFISTQVHINAASKIYGTRMCPIRDPNFASHI